MIEAMLFILVFIFIAALYLNYRNNKVYEFRIKIIDLCSESGSNELDKIADLNEFVSPLTYLFANLPSYREMLLSFKPLTLDNWIEKEKLEKLFKHL